MKKKNSNGSRSWKRLLASFKRSNAFRVISAGSGAFFKKRPFLVVSALWHRASACYKTLRVDVPNYIRTNKRSLLKYTVIYALLWLPEWAWGIPVEVCLLSALALMALVDLGIALTRRGGGGYYLSLLKEEARRRRRPSKLQKLYDGLLITFWVGIRRFLSNPTARIGRSQAIGLAAPIWYVACVASLIQAAVRAVLTVRRWVMPKNYSQASEEVSEVVDEVCFQASLYHTQSFVIAWVLSLILYLLLTSNVNLTGSLDPLPYLKGSATTILLTLAALFVLESLRVSVMNSLLLNQSLLSERLLLTVYFFFQPIWAMLYYGLFELYRERGDRGFVETFIKMSAILGKRAGHMIHWTASLLKWAPLMLGLPVLCLIYLTFKVIFLWYVGP